jgi:hypothetical protein
MSPQVDCEWAPKSSANWRSTQFWPTNVGELVPRVGFIVTNLSRPAERVVAFYNHRGTAEQFIEEGKIIKIRLSNVCEMKPFLTAALNCYGRSEFGGYLGNVG